MGREAVVKRARKEERRVRGELEKSGVAERVRAAYLALQREDIQATINAKISAKAGVSKEEILAAAREVLATHLYGLEGVDLSAKILPSRHVMTDKGLVQEPARIVLQADASSVAIAAARRSTGVVHG